PDDLCDILTREWTDHCRENGIAIDFPTGICSDSGQSLGSSPLRASLVVTFQQEKRGHRLGVWNEDCMALVTVDLGIDGDHPGRCVLVARGQGALDGRHDQWRGKLSSTNKYHSGHALVISGGVGKGGAARLVARGALRIGAGLATVGCPPDAMVENAARLDAIMVRSIADAEELTDALDDTRLNALCLGPGQGVGHTTREMVAVALAARRKTVLDADALSSFAGAPEELFERTHDACVLTPHEGEFGRLFPDLLARLREPAVTGPAYSKVDATREAAARAGCVVLFKGADTVIADPDGRCAINSAHYERAAPWLATAGSGDVLAGFITGLLARGFGPMAAAEAAAWLHVECALTFGPGLIAEDLPEQLPAVFRDLGL
ncbi:MAG: NAD(P)H-hydrate dehydratase, partial [Pseudomonadota bacterium]